MRSMLALCITCSLWASENIHLRTSINDVFVRGTNVTAGQIEFSFDNSAVSAASSENPYYMRVTPDQNTFLANTLVLPDTPSGPIDLALYLKTADDTISVQADRTAVQLVRWVAGESAFWIRFNQSSDTWLTDGTNEFGPSEQHEVVFAVGVPGEAHTIVEEHQRNLPYNLSMYYGTQLPGADTWLCLDTAMGAFPMDGSTSLIGFDIIVYESDAANGGILTAGTDSGITFTGDFKIARTKDRDLDMQIVNSEPTAAEVDLPVKGNGMVVQRQLQVYITKPDRDNLLTTYLSEGSVFVFQIEESASYGFAKGDVQLATVRGQTSYSEPFTLDGQTLYRKASVTWQGSEQSLDDYIADIDVAVRVPESSDAEQIQIMPYLDVKINNTCGGYSFFVDDNDRWDMAVIPGRFIPHITSQNGEFESVMLVTNPKATAENFDVDFYADNGDLITSLSGTMAPGSTQRVQISELTTVSAAYAKVSRNTRTRVSIAYQAKGEGKSPAQIQETSKTSKKWRLYSGDAAITYDGVAVLNTTGVATSFTVSQFNHDGEVLRTLSDIDLGAGARNLLVLNELFENEPGSVYEISAQVPLILTAVRGDWSSEFLWENPAVAVD